MGFEKLHERRVFCIKNAVFLFVTSAYTHTHTHTHTHTQMHTCTHHSSHILFFCIHVITQNTVLHKFTQFLSHTIPVTALWVCIHTIIHIVLHKLSLTTTTQNILTHTHTTQPTNFVRHLPGVWKCGSRKVGIGVTSGRALLKASIKSRRIQSRAKRPLVVAILPLDWFLPPLAFITFRYTLFCNRHRLAVDHAVYPELPFFMPLKLIVCEATQSEIKRKITSTHPQNNN